MKLARVAGLFLGFLLCLLAPRASAQAPQIISGQVQMRAAAADFQNQFRAIVHGETSPGWVGYSAPLVQGLRLGCCGMDGAEWVNAHCDSCLMEGDTISTSVASGGRAQQTGSKSASRMALFFHAQHGSVQQILLLSENCELDTGGLPVIWITGVRPQQSVALLTSFVVSARAWSAGESGERDLENRALAAIAMTAGVAANHALEAFVLPTQPESLRGKTAFWLGSARGRFGYKLLRTMAQKDPSDRARKKVVFALYVSHDSDSVSEIIRMAKDDSSPGVRGQALFWLAQKATKRAVGAVSAAVNEDPNARVRRIAVFAVSRLPRSQGVPLLIRIAETNQHPSVRKQAIFWLGQSRDPRALAFFEQVLEH